MKAMMKVKEFIKQLQSINQNADLYILSDDFEKVPISEYEIKIDDDKSAVIYYTSTHIEDFED